MKRLLRFDPLAHKRNRMGEFTKMLQDMKPGEHLRMPGGVTVKRGQSRTFRISAPMAGPKGLRSGETRWADDAAKVALNASAATPHSHAIGGRSGTTYERFRKAELHARSKDPAWKNVPPEDTDDLIARPTHGNMEENLANIEDLRQEAENTMSDIDDMNANDHRRTGGMWRTGDEQYADAEDLAAKLDKAAEQIDHAMSHDGEDANYDLTTMKPGEVRTMPDGRKVRGLPGGGVEHEEVPGEMAARDKKPYQNRTHYPQKPYQNRTHYPPPASPGTSHKKKDAVRRAVGYGLNLPLP